MCLFAPPPLEIMCPLVEKRLVSTHFDEVFLGLKNNFCFLGKNAKFLRKKTCVWAKHFPCNEEIVCMVVIMATYNPQLQGRRKYFVKGGNKEHWLPPSTCRGGIGTVAIQDSIRKFNSNSEYWISHFKPIFPKRFPELFPSNLSGGSISISAAHFFFCARLSQILLLILSQPKLSKFSFELFFFWHLQFSTFFVLLVTHFSIFFSWALSLKVIARFVSFFNSNMGCLPFIFPQVRSLHSHSTVAPRVWQAVKERGPNGSIQGSIRGDALGPSGRTNH